MKYLSISFSPPIMKNKISHFAILVFFICSCHKEDIQKHNIGQGFEIYIPKKDIHSIWGADYSTFNIDTIKLQEIPVLRYDDILKYDTANHTITLPFSKNQLLFKSTSVHGNMFVATLDKKPIYCGFYWPSISSVPTTWVNIFDVNFPPENATEKKVVIDFTSPKQKDPRKNDTLIARLKQDSKIFK
jgi:hypothetical protein